MFWLTHELALLSGLPVPLCVLLLQVLKQDANDVFP